MEFLEYGNQGHQGYSGVSGTPLLYSEFSIEHIEWEQTGIYRIFEPCEFDFDQCEKCKHSILVDRLLKHVICDSKKIFGTERVGDFYKCNIKISEKIDPEKFMNLDILLPKDSTIKDNKFKKILNFIYRLCKGKL